PPIYEITLKNAGVPGLPPPLAATATPKPGHGSNATEAPKATEASKVGSAPNGSKGAASPPAAGAPVTPSAPGDTTDPDDAADPTTIPVGGEDIILTEAQQILADYVGLERARAQAQGGKR
ncbi:MAG: hypothetical protein RL033_2864, partial [Pseudomonadota bacterium]